MIRVAVCPICDETFDDGTSFREHLGSAHRLFDDPGTLTTIPEPPPEPVEPDPPAPKEKKRRGGAKSAPVQPPPPIVRPDAKAEAASNPAEAASNPEPADEPEPEPEGGPAAGGRPGDGAQVAPAAPGRLRRPPRARPPMPRPKRPRPSLPAVTRPPWLRWPSPGVLRERVLTWARREAPADGRYPLARRYGDVALYGPGALFVLACVVRGRSDLLGVSMALLGTAAIIVAMLLPALHAHPSASPAETAPAPPPSPPRRGPFDQLADDRSGTPLEELLAPPTAAPSP